MNNLTNEQLLELETQLSCPSGENGLAVGKQMDESNRSMTDSAIAALQLKANQQVLEIGHGLGGHIQHLFKTHENIRYFGVEISSTMQFEASNLHKTLVQENVAQFDCYDGITLPYPANSFNRIFTVNTLYFWKNPIAFLEEIKRVLAPNGSIVICFATKDFMEKLPFVNERFKLYNTNDVLKLIESSGNTHLAIEIEKQVEKVKNKSGDWVEREYVNLKLTDQ
tara:strand:+ start:76271 stop:76942 length:672 start_codon:yes stop_codon:yes gene_type:complete